MKEILFGSAAHQKMVTGVNTLANAVKVTLGPKGRNVAIQREYGSPHITKDGVTVAKEITLKDKFENMGAQLVREVASKTADIAGDGTTTATVLAQAILNEGMKAVAAGHHPTDIKRGLDAAVRSVVSYIETIAKPADTATAIKDVGTISANNDPIIGELIASAMQKVGKEGIITVEEGSGFEDTLDVVEGMKFDRGYISPLFINNDKQTCEFENPLVLIIDRKVSVINELVPVIEKVMKIGKPLVLIAEDVDGTALTTLVVNSLKQIIKVVPIKAPAFGDRRKAILEDIAILTGATVVSTDLGMKLEEVELSHLGSARRITVSKETTVIVDGAGSSEAIQQRVSTIRTQLESAQTDYDKEKLQERIAKLAGGVAVLTIGASSEVEMKEKKDRVEDALHATRAAVEEGIVPGGGYTLYQLSYGLGNSVSDTILAVAMRAPFQQILANAGIEDVAEIKMNIRSQSGVFDPREYTSVGYNVATDQYGDMFELGVIDPAKVTRCALEHAVSVIGTLLTTECMIVNADDPKDEMPTMM